jgi:hypothetical protein
MIRSLLFSLIALGMFVQSHAFCGFYVAQADASLFNKTSKVIIARDGDRTAITMASDFMGDVEQFAMVIPVPTVIQKDQIRVVDASIFTKLDAYSSPRLVEYFDEDPCNPRKSEEYLNMEVADNASMSKDDSRMNEALGIKVEASYTVGEYDILVLSAKESAGLKIWLKANGYQVPAHAESILEPYIKNNVKFFVAKVNLMEYAKKENMQLSPLQMTFESNKFMLPIRLGMANAEDDQDMVVYAFSPKGRTETTNYRTIEIPTDRNIPTFIKDNFGPFYAAVFEKAWRKAGENIAVMEYAWDLSSSNYLKCDPCSGEPPLYADLNEAGVFWIDNQKAGGADYQGDIFITRLHIRYNLENFPQDLQFQATPNRENFQARYVMNHPATGTFRCPQGEDYLAKLVLRRQEELNVMASLTGWNPEEHQTYVTQYEEQLEKRTGKDTGEGSLPPFAYALIGAAALGLGLYGYRALRGNRDSVA